MRSAPYPRPPRLDSGASARAVIADDGREIRLILYSGRDALAAVTLGPAGAIGLAGELIAAAHRRMA